MTEKTIFGVHVSPSSAETLVKRGGITNHRLIAYSLSNICATNYQIRLICVEVIVCYINIVFLRHSVVTLIYVVFFALLDHLFDVAGSQYIYDWPAVNQLTG